MNYVAKFRGREIQFRRALGNGALAIVNHELLRTRLGTGVEGWIRQIDIEGERLSLTIDRGEACSHAASTVLGVPIATNDTSAVNQLLRKNEIIPRPILRFWVILVSTSHGCATRAWKTPTISQTLPSSQQKSWKTFRQPWINLPSSPPI